jgi:hypothetical protein
MAAILRVAIGFDRNHDGAVESVQVEHLGDHVLMTLHGSEDTAGLGLEQYSASSRSGLLAERLGKSVVVATAETPEQRAS